MQFSEIETLKDTQKSTITVGMYNQKAAVRKQLYKANFSVYQTLMQNKHPHIPEIYAVTQKDDGVEVIEEFIEGSTLDDYLRTQVPDQSTRFDLALQLCDALSSIHNSNPPIVHRDIKPSNILVTKSGDIKLIDFDAGRFYDANKHDSDTVLLGTKEYAAPEQFGYTQTDVRTDIYAMGIVLKELNLGFDNPAVADRLRQIIDKCTRFDPHDRYSGVDLLRRDIENARTLSPSRKKGIIIISIVAAALVAGILIGFLIFNNSSEAVPATDTSASIPEDVPVDHIYYTGENYETYYLQNNVLRSGFVNYPSMHIENEFPSYQYSEFTQATVDAFDEADVAMFNNVGYREYYPAELGRDLEIVQHYNNRLGFTPCAVVIQDMLNSEEYRVPDNMWYTCCGAIFIDIDYMVTLDNTLYRVDIFSVSEEGDIISYSDRIVNHDPNRTFTANMYQMPSGESFTKGTTSQLVFALEANCPLTIKDVITVDMVPAEHVVLSEDGRCGYIDGAAFDDMSDGEQITYLINTSDDSIWEYTVTVKEPQQ